LAVCQHICGNTIYLLARTTCPAMLWPVRDLRHHGTPLLCQIIIFTAAVVKVRGASLSAHMMRAERERVGKQQHTGTATPGEPVDHRGERMLVKSEGGEAVGALSKAAVEDRERRRALALASLETYQKNYANLEEFIDNFHARSDHMVDGFEESNITKEDLREHLRDAKHQSARKLQQLRKAEAQRTQELLRNQSLMEQARKSRKEQKTIFYDHAEPVVSGFWAVNRPDEERIDPENMRIYKFKSFRKRFPFKHKWDVEVMWKKLPLAPENVRKVQHKRSGKFIRSALLDQDGNELVYTRDQNGFYHKGKRELSDEEVERAAHPMDYEAMMQERQTLEHDDEFTLYQNHTALLATLFEKATHGDMFEREEANWRLELLRNQMRNKLHLEPRRHGKAWISIKGREGTLCSFNVEVGEVTGLQLKKRVEKATGIPWEVQELLTAQRDLLQDGELLNAHLVAGASAGNWLRLREKPDTHLREGIRDPKSGRRLKKQSSRQASLIKLRSKSLPTSPALEGKAAEAKPAAANAEQRVVKPGDRVLTEKEDRTSSQSMSAVDQLNQADKALVTALRQSRKNLHFAKSKESDEDDDIPDSTSQARKGLLPISGSTAELSGNQKLAKRSGKLVQVDRGERKAAFDEALVGKPREARLRRRAHVTRRVEYERGQDGKWQIKRQVHAKLDHPPLTPLSFLADESDDGGIHIESRVSEEVEEEESSGLAFMQLAQRQHLGQKAALKERSPKRR